MAEDGRKPQQDLSPDGGRLSEELVLQAMAILGGSGAVAALPLLSAIATGEAPPQLQLIVFSFPLALAAVGRLRGIRWWQITAAAFAAVLVLSMMFAPSVAVLLIAAGAIGALVTVGRYLLDHDRIGAGVWLTTGSVAVIGGFTGLGAGASGVAAGVAVVVVAGAAVALLRLRRVAP